MKGASEEVSRLDGQVPVERGVGVQHIDPEPPGDLREAPALSEGQGRASEMEGDEANEFVAGEPGMKEGLGAAAEKNIVAPPRQAVGEVRDGVRGAADVSLMGHLQDPKLLRSRHRSDSSLFEGAYRFETGLRVNRDGIG